MTHTDTQQAIQEIMESLGENIEYDQLVNKLVDKNIITTDDVARLNMLEANERTKELLVILFAKEDSCHPLILRILETLKTPSAENTRRADQAIEQAAGSTGDSAAGRTGTRAVCKTERRILSNTDVSTNWELKNFVFELSRDIDHGELEDMKDLMKGERGFKENTVSKIERPMKFFQQLMQTGRLNAYNLHFLQALVRRIGRLDLNERVRQFCLECKKKPIHFFTPSEKPVNGYKYVRHHIDGDMEKLTHVEKERLRADVANALCVPLEFVYIMGIEPAASILFTFMVPEDDVRSFIQICVQEGPSTLQMSIHIHIEGDELYFSESPPSTASNPTSIFQEIKHILEREQTLEDQLADRDEQLFDLQEKLENIQGEKTLDQYDPDEAGDDPFMTGQSQLLELYKGLTKRFMDVMATMQPKVAKNGSSLRLTSASVLYQRLFREVIHRCGVDPGLLNKLLEARALVENMMRDDSLRKMHDIVRMLTAKVEELTDVNGFLRASGASSFLQDYLQLQANNAKLAIDQHQGPGLQINEIGFSIVQRIVPVMQLREEHKMILTNMTKDLSRKERQKLRDFLCFSDAERDELKKDHTKLLELAVLREYRSGTRENIPLNDVLKDILAKIKKSQIVDRYFTIQEPKRKLQPGSKAVQTQLVDEGEITHAMAVV